MILAAFLLDIMSGIGKGLRLVIPLWTKPGQITETCMPLVAQRALRPSPQTFTAALVAE